MQHKSRKPSALLCGIGARGYLWSGNPSDSANLQIYRSGWTLFSSISMSILPNNVRWWIGLHDVDCLHRPTVYPLCLLDLACGNTSHFSGLSSKERRIRVSQICIVLEPLHPVLEELAPSATKDTPKLETNQHSRAFEKRR